MLNNTTFVFSKCIIDIFKSLNRLVELKVKFKCCVSTLLLIIRISLKKYTKFHIIMCHHSLEDAI